MLIQIIGKQQPDSISYRIGFIAFYPFLDVFIDFFRMFLEDFGREYITNRPVIHEWKKSLRVFHSALEIFYLLYKETMQEIFFIIMVRQGAEKFLHGGLIFIKFFGKFPQNRNADADDFFSVYVGSEFRSEIPVFPVL